MDLQACLDGDRDAWERFVREHAALVTATVRRTWGRGGGAGAEGVEDAVQEVFLRLVKDDFHLLRCFDGTRASLPTWLTLVARSVTIDRLRRRRPGTVGLDGAAEQPAPAPEPRVNAGVLPMHLLSPRQRLVIRMIFEEQRPVAEAAALLGVSEQTIRSMQHKALSRLREHFSDQLEDGDAAIGGDGRSPRKRTVTESE